MGNSKIMLLGAVTLMIGMYALKIREADRTVVGVGSSRAEQFQAVELAKTAVDFVVYDLSDEKRKLNTSRTLSLMGGKVAYTVTALSSTEERVTATATFGSETRTIVAYLKKAASGTYTEGKSKKKKSWSQWVTTKVYVQPL